MGEGVRGEGESKGEGVDGEGESEEVRVREVMVRVRSEGVEV